jgi:hypothetical protein
MTLVIIQIKREMVDKLENVHYILWLCAERYDTPGNTTVALIAGLPNIV